jgi:hypothetical protein
MLNFNFSKNSLQSICIFLIALYFLATFGEYFIHKYLMHNIVKMPYLNEYGKEHIKHHVATNKDFTIKNNDSENICFNWMTIMPLYIISILIMYLLFNKIVGLNIILISVFLMLYLHTVIWNTLHSYVHYFDVNSVCEISGIPKEYVNENNFYVKWSLNNHRAHHYFKNDEKGNWNVVYPGADYIMGTHHSMPENYIAKKYNDQ